MVLASSNTILKDFLSDLPSPKPFITTSVSTVRVFPSSLASFQVPVISNGPMAIFNPPSALNSTVALSSGSPFFASSTLSQTPTSCLPAPASAGFPDAPNVEAPPAAVVGLLSQPAIRAAARPSARQFARSAVDMDESPIGCGRGFYRSARRLRNYWSGRVGPARRRPCGASRRPTARGGSASGGSAPALASLGPA